jgi:hypothetical protein
MDKQDVRATSITSRAMWWMSKAKSDYVWADLNCFAVLVVIAWSGPISRTPSFTIESVATTCTPARTLAAIMRSRLYMYGVRVLVVPLWLSGLDAVWLWRDLYKVHVYRSNSTNFNS